MDQKLDIISLAKGLWSQRGAIARIAAVVVALGVVWSLLAEVKWESRVVMAPQTGSAQSGGGLQGLAAMAGLNIASTDAAGGLPPTLYPMVVASVPFQKELMATTVPIDGAASEVTLLDYFTDPSYQKKSFGALLLDYTVGLPRTILGAIRRRRASFDAPRVEAGVEPLTIRQSECMRLLAPRIGIKVDSKNGYIALSASMPQPRMAARTARRAQELLQDYVTRFKIQKVQADLDFIEERYDEVKVDFETRQRALASFQDSHRNITSALARTTEARLQNENDLAFGLYSELARQREQARIAVKEDTPVFTIIEPVVVPFERASPRRGKIVLSSLLLGVFIGIAVVFIRGKIN